MSPINPEVILMIPVFLLSLSVHEFCHALTAKWGGDLTATYQGRLTLNPLAHIDLFGTIILPIVAAVTHAPLFGWAKPVPVVEENFRKREWGIVVALAGPGSNLILVLFATILLKFVFVLLPDPPRMVVTLGAIMIQINLLLMLFNLIPIPPLDGSHVLWHLVIKGRPHLYPLFFGLAQFGMIILMALFVIPQTRDLFSTVLGALSEVFVRFILAR